MSTKHSKAAEKFLQDSKMAAWHNETLWMVRAKRDKMSKEVPEWEELRNKACELKLYSNSHLEELLLEFEKNDMIFAIGPAGSGKTYTAIALAVHALKIKEIKKIILSRPAVEAGEKLGFLPGDMKDKIDPYLQPLYDALQDMIPAAKLKEYMELNVIQIAPLAFMRGRTLNAAVVILDEAQNTTTQQIKMFLTRMGMNTKMIVTGDMTQIDLPASQTSGLVQAIKILKGVKGISFIELNKKDIVRHKLVTRIVEAYEKFEEKAERKTTRTAKEPEKTPQA